MDEPEPDSFDEWDEQESTLDTERSLWVRMRFSLGSDSKVGPSPKGREYKLVEKTKSLHEAVTFMSENEQRGMKARKKATKEKRSFWRWQRISKSTSPKPRKQTKT